MSPTSTRLLRTLAPAVALTATLAVAHPAAVDAAATRVSVVTYAASDAVIANPERGFDHTVNTHYRADGSGFVPLDADVLAGYRGEGITQVVRVFYLEKFVDEPLNKRWLRLAQRDFDTAREAGVSIIPRFAYVEGTTYPYVAPYGDADLPVVLGHIHQLKPLLRRNADVIPVVQSGFIGLWGEGYYTDHFASDPANPGVLTAADWDKRRAVVEALVAALPKDRSVQVRTMAMKQNIVGVPTGTAGALTADQAHENTLIARVGHHNDCLLAAPDDWGTFLSDPITLDQQYLEQDSRYVPVGGETCNVNPPRSEWPSASAEMARYHYSYLNRDYNTAVLDSWGASGIEETAKRLGYRLVVTRSSVTTRGDTATVTVRVKNVGWAAPYNPRPVRLVLTGSGRRVSVPFRTDIRNWAPGTTTTIKAKVTGVAAGRYHAYLAMPAARASIAADPAYAIQTANVGTWMARTGLNDLQQRITLR